MWGEWGARRVVRVVGSEEGGEGRGREVGERGGGKEVNWYITTDNITYIHTYIRNIRT